MIQEKKMTQKVNSAGEYTAPRVKVVEIKARRVMCISQFGTEQNGSDSNPEELNW